MGRHSLIELEAVLAIVRCGSFRAAAVELGLSTTAISNAVGKLERELSVRLFNRTTRSVSLTHAGRIFVAQIRPALDGIQKAMNTARSQQDTPSGTLRINAFATAAREIMAPLVLTYLQRYPQVHIDIVTEGRLVDVVAAGFDLGVRSADLVPSDAIAIPLGPARRMAVVAAPGFFEGRAVPKVPQELLAYPCLRIRLPNGALFRWRFAKADEELQLDVEGPLTLDEASLARIAVTNGVGIGYFMEADVREDIAAGRLVRILDDWTPPLAPLCVYYPSRRNPSAAFRAFIELTREAAAGRLKKP
ncbi:DNA-binding transcriptional LysR family regulator [Sphingomonas kyeonggiensis]|uniref:DNA-binding transcriptional LysR family regulator n=1 Tax=Sphingomonas kyeonggiensis TaxID=1268553 RepID=A0A7W7K5J7_9SPHN|nr:LysR family transcriptional regulator [Sphingomonas kyeonggiensis]MBB4841466.1 DNA-binding transcriptional LysR family regulator [Sphingomonas kyeonggiensis]